MRPRGPVPPFQRPQSSDRPKQSSNHANLLAYFKDTEGQIDLEKITTTVEQFNRLYGNVSPLFSRFFKNRS